MSKTTRKAIDSTLPPKHGGYRPAIKPQGSMKNQDTGRRTYPTPPGGTGGGSKSGKI